MKSCKRCIYLSKSIIDNNCVIYGGIERYKDPYTEEMIVKRYGEIPISDMRSSTGQCGPDRKLYVFFWKAIFIALKNFLLYNYMRYSGRLVNSENKKQPPH